MPLCRGPPPVRASRMACEARCARLVQIFCPWIRQPPSARDAWVRSEARSEPASGSENSWHQICSPVRIGRRKRVFCPAVPKSMIVGPAKSSPIVFSRSGAPARSASSAKMARSLASAPAPPYSFGHDRPAYPGLERHPLPLAPERRPGGEISRLRPGQLRQGPAQPLPGRGAERRLFRRVREIHQRTPSSAGKANHTIGRTKVGGQPQAARATPDKRPADRSFT
jgi:hypothetical protein